MSRNLQFKYYHILITLIVSIQLMCFILVKRQISFFGITTTASGILFPLDIYLFEIIGYCYGYEFSRQAVWINSLAHVLFFGIIELCNILPYGTEMKISYIQAYQVMFQYSFWIVVGSFVGNFFGDFFSAVVVPRSKVFFDSRFTIISIFIVHLMSEFIIISISYLFINIPDGYTIPQIARIIYGTMLVKTAVALVLLPIAKYLIKFIKNAEGMDIFDQNQNYSLFKFNPDLRKLKIVDYKGIYNVKKNLNS